MKKKFLSLFLVAALSVSMFAGCGKGEEKKEENAAAKNETKTEYVSKNGNTMVLTLFQNPKTLDIQKTNADYFIPLQIYDRLVDVTVNEAGETEKQRLFQVLLKNGISVKMVLRTHST